MKSAVEVIAEMFVKGLEVMPDDRQKKIMEKLFGKVVQLTVMNYNEAVVFFCEEMEVNGERKKWIRYKSFPTPLLKCKNCGWKGNWNDLPLQKKDLQLPESDNVLAITEKEEIVEKCPKCGSERHLYWKDWVHPYANVNLYVASQWEVGKFGTIMMGPLHVRLKALINAGISMLRGKTKMVPFSQFLLVVNFASMIL